LQADPHIQAPQNSQSYNRYSYVLNNPMSFTDPSGYFFKKIFKGFKKLQRAVIRGVSKIFGQDFVRTLGNIASFACGPAAAACSGYWNYEFARAHGVSSSGALRGAFTAAVGTYIGASESLNSYQKFAINFALESSVGTQEQSARAMQIQTVGGTYSQMSGGKFANGAGSTAFENMHPRLKQRTISKRIQVTTSGVWSNHVYAIRGQICSTSQLGCDDTLADQIFRHVDSNDVPFFGDDNAQGEMLLIPQIFALSMQPGLVGQIAKRIGPQPITHRSFPSQRISRNVTLPGHFFHFGDVTHRVYFKNEVLYYEVRGTGDGGGFNNFLGRELFTNGVRDVVKRYSM
jgi:hypothetical protein